ncbi:hypothetical protein C8034_v001144 [Colletotrichum sidae]|uniref:Uncharacterized protein n=1 Tax=Colletotrichum sidae TaxID=1347389 RepID=A0A4R8TEM7_9PEZI|nr:hypothetical protein C8034_v001144 [Colletotrichum sidae]
MWRRQPTSPYLDQAYSSDASSYELRRRTIRDAPQAPRFHFISSPVTKHHESLNIWINDERNRRILEVYVPAVAAIQTEEGGLENDDESTYNRTRLGSLRSVCGDELERVASTPMEVLDHYDERAGLCDLDGCNGPRPPDTEEEVARQENRLADLERRLREHCLPEVRDTITAPEELRVLARHVRGLSGPRLGGGRGGGGMRR